jgi:hypothetical protein
MGSEPECSGAAIEPFRGASLRTPDRYWARSMSALGRLSNPSEGPTFKSLISRRAQRPISFAEKDPFRNIPFPGPCSKREKEEEEKDMNLNGVAHLF